MTLPFNLNPIETISVIFGLLCVLLATKENIWSWPTGLISVTFGGIFYYQLTMYVNVLLHFFYFIACIVGWYHWLYGGENKSILKISPTTKKNIPELIIIPTIMFFFLGFVSDKVTNDRLPYTDAFLASISFTAQWMMNKKLLENWWLWIAVDIVYTVVHFQNHNYPSFIMYGLYVPTAAFGYYTWKKSLKKIQLSK